MGIRHELDILLVSENIALKNVELLKGDSYGCTINIKVNQQKKLDFIIILRPDWTEVRNVKKINMVCNGVVIDTTLIKKSFYEEVYSSSVTVFQNTTVEFFSDTSKKYKEEYPIVNINTIKRYYEIKDSRMTCINFESPISDYDQVNYLKDYINISDDYYLYDACDYCIISSDDDDDNDNSDNEEEDDEVNDIEDDYE
ncbi:host-range protein [Goatpox virus]|uniref:Host-range protein n=1 Tax=Goatpox virus TaxID=186805 RepID=A0A5C0PT54_9POXV|nr:host-range protein [Goatpox virus]QEJ79515.1 host-range protein [Goatpox virus]